VLAGDRDRSLSADQVETHRQADRQTGRPAGRHNDRRFIICDIKSCRCCRRLTNISHKTLGACAESAQRQLPSAIE